MEQVAKELQRRINIVYGYPFIVVLEDETIKIQVIKNSHDYQIEIRENDYISGKYVVMVNCFIPFWLIKKILECIEEVE